MTVPIELACCRTFLITQSFLIIATLTQSASSARASLVDTRQQLKKERRPAPDNGRPMPAMKTNQLQWSAVVLACTSILVTPFSARGDQIGAEIADVALAEGGLLVGQVLSSEGAVQPDTEVVILHGDQSVVRTKTDANGVFAARGLRGGQYQVVTPRGAESIRAWAPNTAPPAAREGSLIILGDQVVRGQISDSPRWVWEWCKQHPWLCTIGAITAVGVPLAIASDDDHS